MESPSKPVTRNGTSDSNLPSSVFKSFDPATVTSIKPGASNFIEIFGDDRRSQTLELSVKLYTNALEHDSNDISFYLLRSYALSQCGNFETALADAEEVLKVDDKNPEGYFVKMKALAGLHKFMEAAEAQKIVTSFKSDEEEVELSIKSKIRRDFIIWSASKDITNMVCGESKSKSSKLDSKRSKSSKKEESRKRPADNSDGHSPDHGKRIVSSKITKVDRDRSSSPRGHMDDDHDLHVVDSIGEADLPLDSRDDRGRSRSRSLLDDDRKRYRDDKRRPESISDRRDSGRPSGSSSSRPVRRDRSRSRSPNYSRSSAPPVNIYRFTGIRIRNIYPQVQRKLLESLCGKFGRILNVDIKDREAVVTYDNADSPRRAIADLHNTFIHRISNFSDKLQVRFSLGSNQDKFHMRNVRRIECDECHFYRTTGCEDSKCPERHIPFNQGIDLQPWMKRQHK